MPRSFVTLVQPCAFFANPTTAEDNYFQPRDAATQELNANEKEAGLRELATFHAQLEAHGVLVARVALPAEEGGSKKPDAIFPNNSFSLHAVSSGEGGADPKLHGILWPMSPGRVDEVPQSVLSALATACDSLHDFRHLQELTSTSDSDEPTCNALEGTGALVFTSESSAVFMARSQRGSESVLRLVASLPGCAPFRAPMLKHAFLFDAKDKEGKPVYHTNVVGWVGTAVAGWCMEGMVFAPPAADGGDDVAAIDAELESSPEGGITKFHASEKAFRRYFRGRNIQLLELTFDEMHHFAGNCLELFDGAGRPLLTISAAAWDALRPATKSAITSAYGDRIIVARLPTIERLGGGSVRCLQAHLNYSEQHAAKVEKLAAILRANSLSAPVAAP